MYFGNESRRITKPRVIFNICCNPKISTILTQINSDTVASTS
jgi:hypothetical protein